MPYSKRQLLKTLPFAGITGISLPSKWISPVISSVVLPTHAQTSMNSILLTGECSDVGPNQYYSLVFAPSPITASSSSFTITSHGNTSPGIPVAQNLVFFATHNTTRVILNVQDRFGSSDFNGPTCESASPFDFPLSFSAPDGFTIGWDVIGGGTIGAPTIELANFQLS